MLPKGRDKKERTVFSLPRKSKHREEVSKWNTEKKICTVCV